MEDNDKTKSSTAPEIIEEQNKTAISRIRRLVAELKEVEKRERSLVESQAEEEPPLFTREPTLEE